MAVEVMQKAIAVRDKADAKWALAPGDTSYESPADTLAFCFRSGPAWYAVPGEAVEPGERALAFRDGRGDWRVFRPRTYREDPYEPCQGADPLCSCLACFDAPGLHLQRTYTVVLQGFPPAGVDGAYEVEWVGDCLWRGMTGSGSAILLYAGEPGQCGEPNITPAWYIEIAAPPCFIANRGLYIAIGLSFPDDSDNPYTMRQVFLCDDLGDPGLRRAMVL